MKVHKILLSELFIILTDVSIQKNLIIKVIRRIHEKFSFCF
jgi:hypothetical protein